MAHCPAHHDRSPSLSIRVTRDRVLIHCFVCPYPEVVRALKKCGLWSSELDKIDQYPPRLPRGCGKFPPNTRSTTDYGLRFWNQAKPLHEPSNWPTCLVRYFLTRGLLPFFPCTRVRFHPRMPHGLGRYFPAMLALATDVHDTPRAVQATYLQPDGTGKISLAPPRKSFGSVTACAVRLLEGDDVLVLAEGVETALSVVQSTGEGAYALLGTAGLQHVELPKAYRDRRIVIAADNDAAGTGLAAARAAADRLCAQGFLDVRLAQPPDPGCDYNDLLGRPA